MKGDLERSAVELVARSAPWLAPIPSAFFVARSGMAHLALPLAVAATAAAIIETLGLATVHTALWLAEWNQTKRKSDPRAPTWLAVGLVGVYLATTLGLVVALEVWPGLATYAPALFPLLAVVGALNLALVSRQKRRELSVQIERAERTKRRTERRIKQRNQRRTGQGVDSAQGGAQSSAQDDAPGEAQDSAQNGGFGRVNGGRRARKAALLERMVTLYEAEPTAGPSAVGRALGVHRNTVYNYLAELERQGRVRRNDGRVEVQGA